MPPIPSPSNLVCYDKLGHPVFEDDIVLAANAGSLRRVQVHALKRSPFTGSLKTKAWLHITWLEDKSCGTLPAWVQHFNEPQARLKLSYIELEPDSKLRVHRILKV